MQLSKQFSKSQVYFTPKVRDLMTKDPLTLMEDDNLKSARDLFDQKAIRHLPILLNDHKYGCLPVISEGRLIGIITEADFVKTFINWNAHFGVDS